MLSRNSSICSTVPLVQHSQSAFIIPLVRNDHSFTNLPQKVGISRLLTLKLCATYLNCNGNLNFMVAPPRQCLTAPSEGVQNDNADNSEGNLIIHIRDELLSGKTSSKYTVMAMLGKGTFGLVLRCEQEGTGNQTAVKVIKNLPAYRRQAMIEVQTLRMLNAECETKHIGCIVQSYESFEFKKHVCIVFELLGPSLLDLLSRRRYRGLPLDDVVGVGFQLLSALAILHENEVVHCDVKPENILLVRDHSPSSSSSQAGRLVVKLIDFGSACLASSSHQFGYIQSRFYRAPEIILHHPAASSSIDIWSSGCVLAELLLGLPLLPGTNQLDQLTRVSSCIGPISANMLLESKSADQFYIKGLDANRRLKTQDEFATEYNLTKPNQRHSYFRYTSLDDIISKCSINLPGGRHGSSITSDEKLIECNKRVIFLHMLRHLLCIEPSDRISASQALSHPLLSTVVCWTIEDYDKWLKVARDRIYRRSAWDRRSNTVSDDRPVAQALLAQLERDSNDKKISSGAPPLPMRKHTGIKQTQEISPSKPDDLSRFAELSTSPSSSLSPSSSRPQSLPHRYKHMSIDQINQLAISSKVSPPTSPKSPCSPVTMTFMSRRRSGSSELPLVNISNPLMALVNSNSTDSSDNDSDSSLTDPGHLTQCRQPLADDLSGATQSPFTVLGPGNSLWHMGQQQTIRNQMTIPYPSSSSNTPGNTPSSSCYAFQFPSPTTSPDEKPRRSSLRLSVSTSRKTEETKLIK